MKKLIFILILIAQLQPRSPGREQGMGASTGDDVLKVW